MGGHIIRPPYRPSLVRSGYRVLLPLQQRLGERRVRLMHPDDVRPRRKRSAGSRERRLRPTYLHASREQDADQLGNPDFAPAGRSSRLLPTPVGRDHPRLRPPLPPHHRALPDRDEPAQPLLAVAGRVAEQRERAGLHVTHDVGEPPRPPFPRLGEVPRAPPRVEAPAGLQLVGSHFQRRSHLGARRLGQQAHPSVVVRVRPSRGPGVVRGVQNDTLLPRPQKRPSHL